MEAHTCIKARPQKFAILMRVTHKSTCTVSKIILGKGVQIYSFSFLEYWW